VVEGARLESEAVFQPECAIVDLSLPGMNGIELARRLRAVFPPMTAVLDRPDGLGRRGRPGCVPRRRFDIHLVKPGEIDLLEELLGAERRVNG
jgi:CheY-like chemotaxis protein